MKKRTILITESDMKKLRPIVDFAGVFATRDRRTFNCWKRSWTGPTS